MPFERAHAPYFCILARYFDCTHLGVNTDGFAVDAARMRLL